jgi:hypothetical protein
MLVVLLTNQKDYEYVKQKGVRVTAGRAGNCVEYRGGGGGLRADYQLISGLNFGSLQDSDKFENQGCFALDADLAEHVAQMGTDGIIFDVELVPDLLVVETLTYQFCDLDFSRRQMPAFTKIVPLFILQNHSSSPSCSNTYAC